ncbi:MBL fold metallo-hydrolase [Streptomyces sp. NBS 14/10]|uniref:MBL fold metallo-hydrolase n=1 Tax=Streptomyces sp. NBS 14/10 TaxID=1945643 RepID=UPI000B7E699C|nr:MBL fold metallo-hydrolase [Streptomyces sp. NBS 14/10]KAK1184037.1 MBL fold metallo-hydrolase [Streptomyces sp. NBS 14/10]
MLVFFIDTVDVPGLGNRGYLAGGREAAVVVDPPRDIDRIIAMAARRVVRISHVVETHVHNDYVTGGLELARLTGAAYLVPAGARVAYERVPVGDGDTVDIGDGLALRALATPGHTPHHTAYVLEEAGRAVAVFTGGSLLIGTVGRPDLVEPRLTERLARAQHASVRRLAAELPDQTAVLPTHGFGSFCSSGPAAGDATSIGEQRATNEAVTEDADTFVARLLSGLDDIPAYYAHMGPANAAGPAPVDLTPPARADADEIAARLAAGEWVVDLRNRVAFAEGHVGGTFNFAADGQLATYLAWLLPWGKPVTLLAESPEQLAAAQRELVRVGIDRPAAAATGPLAAWLRDGERPRSFPRATFAELATRAADRATVVLDVRRKSERAREHIADSLHIPVHQLRDRLAEIPAGTVWVHCAGGMRAAIAASLLDAAGRSVVAVDDGFNAAREAGLPVVSGVSDVSGISGVPGSAPARITAEQARTRTAVDGDAVLLDVREPEEWAAGHAPGAVLAPLSALTAGAPLPQGLQGRPLVVICRTGNRSRQAVELLVGRRVDAVDVTGGMGAWAEAGLPVVAGPGDDNAVANGAGDNNNAVAGDGGRTA